MAWLSQASTANSQEEMSRSRTLVQITSAIAWMMLHFVLSLRSPGGCSGIVCWVVRGSLCGCSVVVLRSFWGYHLLLSCLQPTASSLQPPVPNLQPPASSLQLPASNIQPPASDLQAAASTLQLESLWVGSGVILGLFWACSGVRLWFVWGSSLFSVCSRLCLEIGRASCRERV